MSTAPPSLPFGKPVLWTLTLLFAVLVLFYTFWAVTASNYEHTYLRPATAPTGSLYSQRFTADFFFTGSLLLLFFVPFSFAWLLGNPGSAVRQNVHIMFTVLLSIYMIVILLFWGIGFYANANQGTAGNAGNPANDDKWCAVYYTIAGTACDNTVGLSGVTAAQLTINPLFLYKFWFLLAFNVLLIVHFAFVATKFPPLQGLSLSQLEDEPSVVGGGGGGEVQAGRMTFRVPYRNRVATVKK